MDFECRGWPPQPQIFSSSSTKITKNAKFRTSVLRCWRLCKLYSKFKIHSKGCKSNGEALWLCYCLIFLSTYWFSNIFSPFKKHILRWNTLYIVEKWVKVEMGRYGPEWCLPSAFQFMTLIVSYVPCAHYAFGLACSLACFLHYGGLTGC